MSGRAYEPPDISDPHYNDDQGPKGPVQLHNLTVPKIAAACIVVLGLLWWASFKESLPGMSLDDQATQVLRAGMKGEAPPQATIDPFALREAISAAKIAQKATLASGKRALEDLDATIAEGKRWSAEVAPLLQNEQGRQLAADPTVVAAFQTAYDVKRSDPQELAEAKSRVELLLDPVQAAAEDKQSTYKPSTDTDKQIAAEAANARAALHSYQSSRQAIEALLARVKTTEPGAATLAEALDAQVAARSLAEFEEKNRLADKEREAAAKARELQTQKDIEAEEARIKRDGEAARLEALAKDPNTVREFAPFLAHGYMRPAGLAWGKYGEPMAMRQRDLAEMGVFSNISEFVSIACDPVNDRPKWPCPHTTQEWDKARERYALFKQLVPVWIQNKQMWP